MLNPRKILLRVDLAVEIRACQPCERTICQGVEAAEEHGIRQLQEEQTTDQIIAVQEKPFTFTDGVDLGYQRVVSCSASGESHPVRRAVSLAAS